MPVALKHETLTLTLWIVAGAVAVSVIAGLIGRHFVRRGRREPLVVRMINRTSDRVVDIIKKPITVAVLDEVAQVLQTGHYTRNVASALRENREQLKEMIAEKIRQDPTAGRIHYVPFSDRLLEEAGEMTLRVILEVLMDPRTDELVSDLLRDNIAQIRRAVRERTV
jgi:hypothetical protein